MNLYSQELAGELRAAFEAEVLAWPEATVKMMFGCPGYRVGKEMFAFLVTGGIVLTQLPPAEREALLEAGTAEPFQQGGKLMRAWAKFPAAGPEAVASILPPARRSYEAARAKLGAAGSETSGS